MNLPDWSGQRAFVVASGPSLNLENLELLRGENVIAVNCSVEKVPFAQILYSCDLKWWQAYEHLWRGFSGLKYSCTTTVPKAYPEVSLIPLRGAQVLATDGVGSGGCSGYQATNLAYLCGAAEIYVLGVDCKAQGERNHWHKDHQRDKVRLSNPTKHLYAKWAKNFSYLHRELAAKGVPLINLSKDSAMTIPCSTLEDICDTCQPAQ